MDEVWKFPNIFKVLAENSYVTVKEGSGTAYVGFDKQGGCIEFVVFKDFWEKLNHIEKAFVLSHEVLHIYLGHGKRWNNVPGYSNMEKNHAADLAINEALYSSYHFDASKTPFLNSMQIVRLDFFISRYGIEHLKSDILKNNTFEENLLKIPKLSEESSDGNPEEGALDDHSPFENGDEFESDAIQAEAKRIAEDNDMSPPSKAGDIPSICRNAGSYAGSFTSLDIQAVKKKKWESIIVQATKKLFKTYEREDESWLPHRRKDNFFRDSRVLLPLDNDVEAKDFTKEKKSVFFFIDTSGSCSEYLERFMRAYVSVPTETFDVRGFSFDSDVESIISDGKGKYKVSGGGGTNFRAINTMVESVVDVEGIDYPSAVFVLTDGAGTAVSPRHPGKWHWMLTAGGVKHCIPEGSHIYDLKNFE